MKSKPPMPSRPLPDRVLAPGPFKPTWESLARGYRAPDWFRDAKFGIWAHWGAQCVPEAGDWYARNMYIQGQWQNEHHLRNYGHPTKFGFKEFYPLWKAEKWNPAAMLKLYKEAGARYFVAMANHHDNFDHYDSRFHGWNSVKIGPRRDIVAGWSEAARKAGLPFGVSVHSAHAWHWFQTAYAYDPEGSQKGKRYDAWQNPGDGKGTWWEGLDPQELYTGPLLAAPAGIRSRAAMEKWQGQHTGVWNEEAPQGNPFFTDQWFLRTQDLVDRYRPDLLYFDNTGLPLGQAGLDITAHYYNASRKWKGGAGGVVVNGKKLLPAQKPALVEDFERGGSGGILELPWQTDTCIGSWHYDRSIYERRGYKGAGEVLRKLIDIVSKNGNLLLSIPVRGDGSLDEIEVGLLKELAEWMPVNGEGIFGTRPWKTYGEGNLRTGGGMFNEANLPYSSSDIRYTTRGATLYAFALNHPADGKLTLKCLAGPDNQVEELALLGYKGRLKWRQDREGLHVELPAKLPSKYTVGLRIRGRKLLPVPGADAVQLPLVAPGPDGTLMLDAASAGLLGDGISREQRDGVTNLSHWFSSEAAAAWSVDFKAPGRFRVKASCASLDPWLDFVVECGASRAETRAKSTGSWEKFKEIDAGFIEVARAGKERVVVKARSAASWKALNLRYLRLEPQ